MPEQILPGAGPSASLRRLESGDAPDVLAAFGSHRDMARQGEVTTLEQARTYVDRLVDPDGGHLAWAVLDPGGIPGPETEPGDGGADPAVVGLVSVSVDAQNRNGWFWYWMNAAHRGRGLTSTAARAVADWALTETPDGAGLHRLELGHRVNNPASAAVARAAGFVQEGLEREKFLVEGARIDVATYGCLRTDPWPGRRG